MLAIESTKSIKIQERDDFIFAHLINHYNRRNQPALHRSSSISRYDPASLVFQSSLSLSLSLFTTRDDCADRNVSSTRLSFRFALRHTKLHRTQCRDYLAALNRRRRFPFFELLAALSTAVCNAVWETRASTKQQQRDDDELVLCQTLVAHR